MVSFWWVIGAFFVGSTLGLFTSALCQSASQYSNENEEKEEKE